MTSTAYHISDILSLDDDRVSANRGTLEDIEQRAMAADALAGAPGMRHAFIAIEKVMDSEPRFLFGQRARSIAYNRLTVFAGETNAEGAVVPGGMIAAVDLSDHALSNVLFMADISTPLPVTLSGTDGAWLPPFIPEDRRSHSGLAVDQMQDMLSSSRTRLEEAREILRSGRKPRREDIRAMQLALNYLGKKRDIDFILQQHVKNVAATKLEVEFEVFAAIANSSLPKVLLAAPTEEAGTLPTRTTSPVWDRTHGTLTEADEAALREGLCALLDHRLVQNGIPAGSCSLGEDPQGRKLRDFLRSSVSWQFADSAEGRSILAIGRAWNAVANESVLEARRLVRPREMGLTATRIHGGADDLHSSYGAGSDMVVRMRLSTCAVEVSFGRENIREVDQVLDFVIRAEDLMLALRDGGTGEKTPCTLEQVCGRRTKNIPAPVTGGDHILETVDADVEEIDAVLDGLSAKFSDLVSEKGLRTKAGIAAALDILDEAAEVFDTRQRPAVEAAVSSKAIAYGQLIQKEVARRMDSLPAISSETTKAVARLIGSGSGDQ